MKTYKTAIVCRHVEAVSAMLLGSRRLKASAAIIAGEAIDHQGRTTLSQMASAAQLDIVHLEFGDTVDGYELANISVVMPRGTNCHIVTGCRLWLSRSGSRAVILPPADSRGLFRLASDEIVHVDRASTDVDAGIARAAAHLQRLVDRGVSVAGQVEVNVFPLAA